MMMRNFVVAALLALLLTGCSGGAVVFAPTPAPPDTSPFIYVHPSGAFSVSVPRSWAVQEQNTTQLAAAAFSAPGSDEPGLRFAVMNTGTPVDAALLGETITAYQTQVRPDVRRYTETIRQAMGDGSWRMSGLRQTVGGQTQALNTFIQRSGDYIGVIEVLLPADEAQRVAYQNVVNTFTIGQSGSLQPAQAAALADVWANPLEILNVATWTTPAGVFFVTGEVANRGAAWAVALPVRAVLQTADGLPVAEAVDTVMGYGLPPGGFAPFSLRFGQGQPALSASYHLSLGGEGWATTPDAAVYGTDELTWDDQSTFEAGGVLVISGSATNISDHAVRAPRALATVFDADGRVIAAGFTDFVPELPAGGAAAFRLTIPDLGAAPANYILNIQGLP